MNVLSGAAVVTPDRVLDPATVILDEGRIIEVHGGARPRDGRLWQDLTGHLIVPGFIDVHVHGVEGEDTLASAGAVAAMASRLPKYGVTAFCPTTVACGPIELRRLLDAIRVA